MHGRAALLDGTVVLDGPVMVGQAAPAPVGIQDGGKVREHHGSKKPIHRQYNVNNNVIVSNEIYFRMHKRTFDKK